MKSGTPLLWFCIDMMICSKFIESRSSSVNSTSFSSCHEELNRYILSQSYVRRGDPAPRHVTTCTDKNCSAFQSSKIATSPRVAHCIAGSARTFWREAAFRSIQENFIDAFGGDYNTFIYIKLDDSRSTFFKRSKETVVNVNLVQLEPAFAFLKPTTLVVAPEKPGTTYSLQYSGCELVGYSEEQQSNFVGQYDTLHDCFSLIVEYEKRYRMKFDWISRIRPDSAIIQPIQPWHDGWNPEYFYIARSLHIDHIGLFPRGLSEVLFQRVVHDFFGCGSVDWQAYKAAANLRFDIQAYFQTQPPLLGKLQYADIPVFLIRGDNSEIRATCSIWVKKMPSVFNGDNEEAARKCFDFISHEVIAVPKRDSTWSHVPDMAPMNNSTEEAHVYSESCKILFHDKRFS